jgi:MinD superfamily P-loop ATPase
MVSRTKYGPFSHARLHIGAEASGKLVTEVRKNAEKLAQNEKLVIIDGAPGTGCPVIASLSGTDLALAVTEPSVSGLHDLERILGVARHFGVEALVCINKYNLSPEVSEEIALYCRQNSIDLVGKIPFDPAVLAVVKEGRPVESLLQTEAGKAIEEVWNNVISRLFPEGQEAL